MKQLSDYLYYEEENPSLKIYCGDCLEILPLLPRVDLVVTDPPYGTTGNEWDICVNLNIFWGHMKEVDCAVLTSSQPFTTDLINSNRKEFKYCWVWNKKLAGNGILAGKQPLKVHEDVCVFKAKRFYPQMHKGSVRIKGGIKDNHGTFNGAESKKVISDIYHPTTIIDCSIAGERSDRTHPTEKPVKLMGYFIRTYSCEKQTILDPFLGSGTTLVACKELNRSGIGIEISEKYCAIAKQRLKATTKSLF